MLDPGVQLEFTVRVVVAAVLGAIVGLEREVHEHPAGIRTHLLVATGSALFTVMSLGGFGAILASGDATNLDPTRIAAQIVSGIGFLGAGAIVHSGTFIRGLTTAASLWATAAIGLAAGAGQPILAVGVTLVVVLSLGPLNRVVTLIRPEEQRMMELRLGLSGLESLGRVSDRLATAAVDLVAVDSRKAGKGRYEVTMRVRLPARMEAGELVEALREVPDVEIVDTATGGD